MPKKEKKISTGFFSQYVLAFPPYPSNAHNDPGRVLNHIPSQKTLQRPKHFGLGGAGPQLGAAKSPINGRSNVHTLARLTSLGTLFRGAGQ